MNCACQSCITIVSAPPTCAWAITFAKDLETGRVIHIGDTPDGRAIYRVN
jgi:hypothetical protein